MSIPKDTTPATSAACTAAKHEADDDVQQREAEAIIARLGMRAHVEGGYYAIADDGGGVTAGADAGRAPYSVIYFLLTRQQKSHWHKLDAAEVWFWHSGTFALLARIFLSVAY